MSGKMGDQRKSTSCLDFARFQDLTLEAGQAGMEKEKLHGFDCGILLRKV